jgi:hypothetical protein
MSITPWAVGREADGAHMREEDTVIALVIDPSATLGGIALGLGLFVLDKPPPSPGDYAYPATRSETGGDLLVSMRSLCSVRVSHGRGDLITRFASEKLPMRWRTRKKGESGGGREQH